MNNLTRIYIVRHGQSRANAGEYTDAQSVNESSLSELGINQSTDLREKLKNIKFDAIFSSDLARTQETAEIIALETDLKIKTSNLIRERSAHDYRYESPFNGDEHAFYDAYQNELKDLDDKSKMQFKLKPNHESAEEGALRLLNFIREIAVGYTGKTIMVVCHGNIMRSLLTHLGYNNYDQLPHGSIANTGYFVLDSDGVDFFVKEVSGVNIQEGSLRGF